MAFKNFAQKLKTSEVKSNEGIVLPIFHEKDLNIDEINGLKDEPRFPMPTQEPIYTQVDKIREMNYEPFNRYKNHNDMMEGVIIYENHREIGDPESLYSTISKTKDDKSIKNDFNDKIIDFKIKSDSNNEQISNKLVSVQPIYSMSRADLNKKKREEVRRSVKFSRDCLTSTESSENNQALNKNQNNNNNNCFLNASQKRNSIRYGTKPSIRRRKRKRQKINNNLINQDILKNNIENSNETQLSNNNQKNLNNENFYINETLPKNDEKTIKESNANFSPASIIDIEASKQEKPLINSTLNLSTQNTESKEQINELNLKNVQNSMRRFNNSISFIDIKPIIFHQPKQSFSAQDIASKAIQNSTDTIGKNDCHKADSIQPKTVRFGPKLIFPEASNLIQNNHINLSKQQILSFVGDFDADSDLSLKSEKI